VAAALLARGHLIVRWEQLTQRLHMSGVTIENFFVRLQG
jgi:hypothetical protein